MTKQLIHLPSHHGTIKTGRIAQPGETITCKPCRKLYEFNLAQAQRLGEVAIKSATENWTPPAYVPMGSERYSGMMAQSAVTYAQKIIDYKL